MSKTKISEFSSDPANNTDIDGINIAEGCAPSGINNAIRELMAQLKEWQSGTSLDTFNTNYMVATAVDINGGAIDGAVIGANSAAAATFTTATATTFNATTVDSTSIEVTNIKAKDGTAAATIADSTGVFTHSTTTVFPAGAVGTPSITTAGDTNTGIYFPAADTIAFTEGGAEAMRIDSSGNVGIGTSSPDFPLTVQANGAAQSLKLIARASGNSTSIQFFNNANDTLQFQVYSDAAESVLLSTSTRPLNFYTNGSERMRIDSSGNVGIGTTTPARQLTVYGSAPYLALQNSTTGATNTDGLQLQMNGNDAYLWNFENSFLAFGTNNTERMRIQSGGSVSMGSGLALGSLNDVGSSFAIGGSVISAGAGTYPMKWNASTGAVTYDTSSRLVKDNIQDSPYGLAEVLQLQPRKYFRTDDQKDEIGFIADEVKSILPEFVPMVAKSVFTKDEEDTELIAGGVNYEKLTAVLTKAIQELKSELDSVKAELATLKGN